MRCVKANFFCGLYLQDAIPHQDGVALFIELNPPCRSSKLRPCVC
jgi:hypothetical protein